MTVHSGQSRQHAARGLAGAVVLLLAVLVTPGTEPAAAAGGAWRNTNDPRLSNVHRAAARLEGPACRTEDPPGWCGDVLVAGGGDNTAEIFHPDPDPQSEQWRFAAPMTQARERHTATLLDPPPCRDGSPPEGYPCGKVLVVGGEPDPTRLAGQTPSSVPELYDPASDSWEVGTALDGHLKGHKATLLEDGRVLFVEAHSKSLSQTQRSSTSYVYDPATDKWKPTGSRRRVGTPQAMLLLDGPACRSEDPKSWCGTVLALHGGQPEVFDPDATDPSCQGCVGAWSEANESNVRRTKEITATQLDGPQCAGSDPSSWCGKVLLAGKVRDRTGADSKKVTELYDPDTETWTTTGELNDERSGDLMSTLLADGRVLLAGGSDSGGTLTTVTEVYDPTTGTWSQTGSLEAAVGPGATTTRLANGWVLLVWGDQAQIFEPGTLPPPGITEVDPPRAFPGGGTRVKITGSNLGGAGAVRVGDRETSRVVAVSEQTVIAELPKNSAGVFGLTVVTGGGESNALDVTYVAPEGRWVLPGFHAVARKLHTASLLEDGTVLVAGGIRPDGSPGLVSAKGTGGDPEEGRVDPQVEVNPEGDLRDHAIEESTEIFQATAADPATGAPGTWQRAAPMTVERAHHAAAVLGDGRLLVSGGVRLNRGKVGGPVAAFPPTESTEIYDREARSWQVVGPMSRPRSNHTATTLGGSRCQGPAQPSWCGQVLVTAGTTVNSAAGSNAGGFDGIASAEVFVPVSSGGVWMPAPPMSRPRTRHTATQLDGPTCAQDPPDWCGDVLVVGGRGPTTWAEAELYDPDSGRWRQAPPMGTPRHDHTATLLPDGRVLVAGGSFEVLKGTDSASGMAPEAEVYDPATNTWSSAGRLLTPRRRHTATLLPDGRVLLAAGNVIMAPFGPTFSGTALLSSELWDPTLDGGQGGFLPAGNLIGERYGASRAVLLPDGPGRACGIHCGRVLVSGGVKADGAALSTFEVFVPQPRITAVTPAHGPITGGTTVTITGRGLAGTTEVAFGGVKATKVTPDPDSPATTLRAVAPPGTDLGTVDVKVTVQGLPGDPGTALTATEGAAFTYETGPPGPVTDLMARATSQRSVELSFTAPGDGRGGVATSYVVGQATSPIEDETDFEEAFTLCGGVCDFEPAPGKIGDPATLTVSDLTPDTTYHYAVRATNDAGELGPLSNTARVTTSDDTVLPGGISDLEATPLSTSQVRLTWSAPGSDGADPPPPDRYIVKQSTSPIEDETDFEEAFTLCGVVCAFDPPPGRVGTPVVLTVRDLSPATTYYYAVKAVDDAGNIGPRSNTAGGTTLSAGSAVRAAMAAAGDSVLRLAGEGRIQTAVALSRDAFPEGAPAAVLARADAFPDALAAGSLAAEVGGPVLLTGSNRLSRDASDELRRLGAEVAYLIGGPAALSEQVAEQVGVLGVEVRRLAGASRTETAAAVAGELARLGGAPRAAVVARADQFADALAAGSLAAAARAPVLLTGRDHLPSATRQALDGLDGDSLVYIAGGPAAVGPGPEREIADAGHRVSRLAGPDRYSTAVALVEEAVRRGAGREPTLVASGSTFPDALAAVPAAHALGGSLLLVAPHDLAASGPVGDYLGRYAGTIDTAVIAGGPVAVSGGVERQIAAAIADQE